MNSYKVAVIVPCYKRPEYTKKCIASLEQTNYPEVKFYLYDDGSLDSTEKILAESNLPNKVLFVNKENVGLRNIVIDFMKQAQESLKEYDFIAKVDNDCVVPENWLVNILSVFEKNPDVDILSPNVYPSNAAFKLGKDDKENKGYREARTVGGLWVMKRKLIDGLNFESINTNGIVGAYNILDQIILETDPKIGWVDKVTVQDLGHWSGNHPENIKSIEHETYYREVGRKIAW